MNNEVKTLKKSFVMAILSLLLLLVIATGAAQWAAEIRCC